MSSADCLCRCISGSRLCGTIWLERGHKLLARFPGELVCHARLCADDPHAARRALSRAAGPRPKENGAAAQKAPAQPAAARPERAPPVAVFVRGLPLDVDADEVRRKLAAFGTVTSCRLVKHKLTGRAKGTAFVDFAGKEGEARPRTAMKFVGWLPQWIWSKRANTKASAVSAKLSHLFVDALALRLDLMLPCVLQSRPRHSIDSGDGFAPVFHRHLAIMSCGCDISRCDGNSQSLRVGTLTVETVVQIPSFRKRGVRCE